MPTVSVIIPTYNSVKFLSRTIRSVLEQTYQDFELIIVDDASSDSTANIIRSFAEKDARIKYIILESNSGGPARPTNKGLAIARGEYIAFLDHDDEWLPSKLEEQIALLRSSPSDVGAVVCDVSLMTSGAKEYIFPDYPTKELALHAMLCANFFFNFSILLIKKEAMQKVGILDEQFVLGADHDYYIRIAKEYRIGVVHKPLLLYVVHTNNLSGSALSVNNSIADLKRLLDKYNDLFASHPECYHKRMIQLSSALTSVGKFKDARITLHKIFKLYPLAIDVLGYYVLTFMGRRVHHVLKSVKNKF